MSVAGKAGDLLQYHGSLVALEGQHDTVSTQLRLLPKSPSILALPPLQYYMKEQDHASTSDPTSCILELHGACQARAAMARSFLHGATPNSRRLVVMNGGTSSAQLECITAISKSHTDGDTAKAQSLFNELVRDGVAGLKRKAREFQENHLDLPKEMESGVETTNEAPEDPITRIMRAADALDEETASLQESNELDLTIAKHRRSMSAPSLPKSDDLGKPTTSYLFGQATQRGQTHLAKQVRSSANRDSMRNAPKEGLASKDEGPSRPTAKELHDKNIEPQRPGRPQELVSPRTPRSVSVVDLVSPRTGIFDSPPSSPRVVYGEATVVTVRPTERLSILQRTKSVDHIHTGGIRRRHGSGRASHSRLLSAAARRRCPSAIIASTFESTDGQILRSKFYHEKPRVEDFKPGKSIVRKNAPPWLDLRQSEKDSLSNPTKPRTSTNSSYVDEGTFIGPCYVDRGSYAGEIHLSISAEANPADDTPFEAVLPMVEDLVICFTGDPDAENPLFDSIIQGFKDGVYPVSSSAEDLETDDDMDSLGTPTSQRAVPVARQDIMIPPTTDPACRIDGDDYDPFAAHGNYLHPQGISPRNKKVEEQSPAMSIPTPPSSTHSNDRNFHELSTAGLKTAVCVQNALRSTLNTYFPPEQSGNHQFGFPSLPELGSVWKPVFRRDKPEDVEGEQRKIDLIVAVGAQAGVSKEFISGITSSLEKLGTKPNGTKRSGRLDLRYLIANAMQSFTSQPLANQIRDNPFCDRLLLATLVIPHLEIYMATHANVSFLILEYPPDHLSTILAMQRLVGADLLRVAGIRNAGPIPQDSRSSRPPSPSKSLQSSPSNSSTVSIKTPTTSLFPRGARASEMPLFSKANFVLTSLATESETASFISAIWKLLIGISPFYIPDGAPRTPAPPSRRTSSAVKEKGSMLFVDRGPEYPPLAAATTAIMSSFPKPPPSPARATFGDDFDLPPVPPAPPYRPTTPRRSHLDRPATARSGATPRSPDARSIRSARTARTARSQKIYRMLGKEAAFAAEPVPNSRPGTAVSYFDDDSSDDEERFREDERKYMPLFLLNLRKQGAGDAVAVGEERRKGNSRKALKWLGLA